MSGGSDTVINAGGACEPLVGSDGTKRAKEVPPERSVYRRVMDTFASPGHLSRGLAGPRGSIAPVAAQRSEKEAIELASEPIRSHVRSVRAQRSGQIAVQLEKLKESIDAGVSAAEMASEGKRGWLRTSAATWGVALALTLATGGIAIPMLVLTSVRLLIAIGDVHYAEKDLDAARRIRDGETGVKRPPMGANCIGNLICSVFCPNPTDRQKAYVTGVVMAFRVCLGIAMIAVAGFIKVPATLLQKGIRAAASVVGMVNEVQDNKTSELQTSVKEKKADALLALEAIRLSYLAQVEARISELNKPGSPEDDQLTKLKSALEAGDKGGAWAKQKDLDSALERLGKMDETSFDNAVEALVRTTATEWQAAYDLGGVGDLYKGMLRVFSATNLIRNAFTIIPALIAAA